MRSARRSSLAIVLLPLLGCRSVVWQEGGTEVTWRGASLRTGDLARVGAVREDDATAIYLEFEDLCAALRSAGVTPPGPPLLLVVAADQELLFGTPEATLERLASQRPEPAVGQQPEVAHAVPPNLPKETLAAMARAAAGAVRLGDEGLGLPAAWCVGVEWAMVVPTADSREAAADAALDFALSSGEIPFAARLLLVPMMPFVRSKARRAMDATTKRSFLEVMLAAARRTGPVPADALAKCLRALGIDESDFGDQAPDSGEGQ